MIAKNAARKGMESPNLPQALAHFDGTPLGIAPHVAALAGSKGAQARSRFCV